MKLNLAPARARGEQLFSPLGHHRNRFFFRASGTVWWWTSGDLCRLGAALTLHPDITHWRAMYPVEGGKAGAVDWERAGSDLIRMSMDAGPYTPAPGEGPAPVGRPPLTEQDRARRLADGRSGARRNF